MGRSPTGIVAELETRHPGNVFAVPLSSFRPGTDDKWSVLHGVMPGNAPTPLQKGMLNIHFAEFLPGLPLNKDILLIDYVQGAQSLIAAQHFLQEHLAGTQSTANVLALALHRDSDTFRVNGIYDAIAKPKNPVWNPLDWYYMSDQRTQWGQQFTSKEIDRGDPISAAFSKESFDPYAPHGSYKLLEQDPNTFNAQRPRNVPPANDSAYAVLQEELANVAQARGH